MSLIRKYMDRETLLKNSLQVRSIEPDNQHMHNLRPVTPVGLRQRPEPIDLPDLR